MPLTEKLPKKCYANELFIETSWKINMDATLSHVGSIRFEIMVSNRGVIQTVRKR